MSTKVVDAMTGVVRPIANFPASVWGDHFLKYASSSTHDSLENKKEDKIYNHLKENVKEKLMSLHLNLMSSSDKLNFIDAIRRLGVSYHFNTEIEQVLRCMYIDDQGRMNHFYENNNLHDCALRFRLLRQQGYNISPENMFKKFLDRKGEFATHIKNDIKGMLSLLEATQLRLRGEDVLEKAFHFTTKQLKTMLLHNRDLMDHMNPHLAQQVTDALNQSLLKGFIRIEARKFLSFYENCNKHDTQLLKFAKLDFNILQMMHQRELAELTRWWKNLNFKNKCPFARDRLVEGYFLSVAMYFEPEYAYGREVVTKIVSFLSVLDDIYDAYATWEELVLFTDAINRWEENDLNKLPECIRYFHDALHDYIEVLQNECVEREMMYVVPYLKQLVKVLTNAYMEEARWLHNRYIPRLEEYMRVATISAGTLSLAVASFIGMDPMLATEETFHWAFEDPPIMKMVASIVRLVDDIVGFKFEQEREHVASSVQCYMNQYGVSEDIAIYELKMRVINTWKDINSELIQSTNVPKPLLNQIVGLAIYMVLYREVDGYTHPESKVKDLINLFVNPVDV